MISRMMGSMAAFWVVHNQFQKFNRSQFTLGYDSQMTDNNLLNTLRNGQYDRRVNKRLMKIQESMIDSSKELDADLVVTESSKTGSEVQYDSIKSANDTDVDDADIRPIYNEEPMAEVQLTVKCNIFAIGQQLTEQPKIINEGRVDQYPE
ncbi:hypothetical protein Tco_0256119 [Tanacetum coccineum]|uniref:Uncharacterized protein n=1 Tax=Tanacetum coccineum TaxID=301880 RepID=A0ABQ5ID95_9ASTR